MGERGHDIQSMPGGPAADLALIEPSQALCPRVLREVDRAPHKHVIERRDAAIERQHIDNQIFASAE